MRSAIFSLGVAAVFVAGCGSTSEGSGGPGPDQNTQGFPPAKPGYTRIFAPTMADLAPGTDIMHCQYVMEAFDRDMDILAVEGYQSTYGHHSIAYATTSSLPIGTTRPCQEADLMSGAFLGGIGGEAGADIGLPEGVAFRLAKGNGILLNTHFLNVSDETIKGETVLDIRFSEVDLSRKVANMFINITFNFEVGARNQGQAEAQRTMTEDLDFIMFTNHMHDYGARAITELTRTADGSVEQIHEDPAWTYEMQFNADYSRWDVAQPLTMKTGDVLRTRCEWDNPTDASLAFPREMCVGVGFYLVKGTQ
jgi:hypothetical protein